MAILLDNLNVDCYRGLSHIELTGFNHVNILVGDNNVGKTSVMEMIFALNAPYSLDIWNEIARKKSNSRGFTYYSAYQTLFPIDNEKRIKFEGSFFDYGMVSVSVSAEEYNTTISEKELNRINGLIKTGNQNSQDSYVDTKVLEISINSRMGEVEFEIYDFQRRPPRIPVNDEKKSLWAYNTVFLEPRDGLENDFSYLKKVILDSEYYSQLVEILKEFDQTITGIIAVEDMGRTEYYVRTSNHNTAIPISVYGDGLKKALIIFACMASNKDGIVLVDEIESSIHTSAMKKVFLTILNWAKKIEYTTLYIDA